MCIDRSRYLERPAYSRRVNLEAPSDEDVQDMFNHVDCDGSGEVDLLEVQQELVKFWPHMDRQGFQRGA
jgi:hypothetical protein